MALATGCSLELEGTLVGVGGVVVTMEHTLGRTIFIFLQRGLEGGEAKVIITLEDVGLGGVVCVAMLGILHMGPGLDGGVEVVARELEGSL